MKSLRQKHYAEITDIIIAELREQFEKRTKITTQELLKERETRQEIEKKYNDLTRQYKDLSIRFDVLSQRQISYGQLNPSGQKRSRISNKKMSGNKHRNPMGKKSRSIITIQPYKNSISKQQYIGDKKQQMNKQLRQTIVAEGKQQEQSQRFFGNLTSLKSQQTKKPETFLFNNIQSVPKYIKKPTKIQETQSYNSPEVGMRIGRNGEIINSADKSRNNAEIIINPPILKLQNIQGLLKLGQRNENNQKYNILDLKQPPIHSFNLFHQAQKIQTRNKPIHSFPVPTNNIPTNNIPKNNIPTNNIPTNNIPTNNIPITNIPIATIPITNIPINNIPITNIPINNIPSDKNLISNSCFNPFLPSSAKKQVQSNKNNIQIQKPDKNQFGYSDIEHQDIEEQNQRYKFNINEQRQRNSEQEFHTKKFRKF